MNDLNIKYVIVLLSLITVIQAEVPPNFPICKNADEVCMVESANAVIQKHYSGLPEIDLAPFDPLYIKSLLLKRNPSSPVNVEVKLSNMEVEGFRTMKVSHFEGLKADLSGRNSMTGIIDHLEFKGHYIIDGKVMILPISGEGNARFTCKNLSFKYSFDFKPMEKNGKTYATLEHVKLEVEPEHVEFFFDSLFNGDKALTETTNEFINTNWKELYREVQTDLSKKISLIIKSYINKVLHKHPYVDYFQ